MSWLKFFFDWRGRVDRVQFLIGVLLVGFLASFVGSWVNDLLAPANDWRFGLYSWTKLLAWAVTFPLVSRRLHDVGLSAWWALVFPILELVNTFVLFQLDLAGIIGALVALALVVLLVLWPGEPTQNRFGAPP